MRCGKATILAEIQILPGSIAIIGYLKRYVTQLILISMKGGQVHVSVETGLSQELKFKTSFCRSIFGETDTGHF